MSKTKEDTLKTIKYTLKSDTNEDKTCIAWQRFKQFMYLKCNAHCHKIDTEMQLRKKDEKEKKEEALERQKLF